MNVQNDLELSSADDRQTSGWEGMTDDDEDSASRLVARDKSTVLIVDDDVVARMTLEALLDRDGYRIETVESADEALQNLHRIQPDVILCDLVMRGINGDHFCRLLKLHRSWQYIPIIAVTRIDNSVAIAAMLEAGADDVVVKPVKARELRARVNAALRTRERYLDLARRAYDRRRREQWTETSGRTAASAIHGS
jgi:DNA-binding response OmpR family regulator